MSSFTPDLQAMSAAAPAASEAPAGVLRVAFKTLGCRLNQYDTEGIRMALAEAMPIRVVDWLQSADLYVLNSCTVTAKADQECRRLARQVKRRAPGARVVVAGCYAQTQPEVLAAMPEIDGVVGNSRKQDVGAWLPDVLGPRPGTTHAEEFGKDHPFDSPLIDSFSGRSRAFVKVQDGCNLRCTYCLIWQARGPGRSRPEAEVLAQLGMLVDAGYAETILAGIHLGGYGRDLAERSSLVGLLRRCLEAHPELRIRLSSIHPNEVTAELLELFAAHPNLRRHLHVSLQSGSGSVLRRMKRPYRGDRAWDALRAIAAVDPNFGIGADLIVGFPGETDAEFEETRRMVEELPFTYLHVFRFSPRPGTPAADMDGQVHPETVTARSAVLRGIARRKQAAFLSSLGGSLREAVLEAESEVPGRRCATTDNYATVHVPQDDRPVGALVRVRCGGVEGGRLLGAVEEG